jgi:hypothetical protein
MSPTSQCRENIHRFVKEYCPRRVPALCFSVTMVVIFPLAPTDAAGHQPIQLVIFSSRSRAGNGFDVQLLSGQSNASLPWGSFSFL